MKRPCAEIIDRGSCLRLWIQTIVTNVDGAKCCCYGEGDNKKQVNNSVLPELQSRPGVGAITSHPLPAHAVSVLPI